MSRNRLFVVAFALAVTSFTSLIFGISLQNKDIRSYHRRPLQRILP